MIRSLTASLCLLACLGCKDPAKDKPRAEIAPAQAPGSAPAQQPAAPLAALPGAVPYVFSNPDSKLLWTASKVSLRHPGGFNVFSGVVELVEGSPTKSRVQVDIDLGSVFTDSQKLIGHLKSPDFFHVERFPRASFVSDAVVEKAGAAGTYEVSGTLDLHGVRKHLTFPAAISVDGDAVTVKAEFVINRKDFGIVYPGRPDDLISDDVSLALDLVAKKKG